MFRSGKLKYSNDKSLKNQRLYANLIGSKDSLFRERSITTHIIRHVKNLKRALHADFFKWIIFYMHQKKVISTFVEVTLFNLLIKSQF